MNAKSRVLLQTGNKMPIMGLGTWRMANPAGTVGKALRLGYRLVDTSGNYGTQPGVGRAIRNSGLDRAEIYLTTKIEKDDDAYRAARRNIEELELDYADLMLIHWPPENGVGVELWNGLIRAKREGLTKDIGVSNYSADRIEALIDATGEVPVVNQIEWSPFGHSTEMLAYCQDNGIIIQSYSPLTRHERLGDETLKTIAKQYKKTPAQLLIRWNVQLGNVPIVKADREQHLKDNLDVFDFEISDDDMIEIGSLNERYSILGLLPYV